MMVIVQKPTFWLKLLDTISMSKSQAQAHRCSLLLTLMIDILRKDFMPGSKKNSSFLIIKLSSLAAKTIHAMKVKGNVTPTNNVPAP